MDYLGFLLIFSFIWVCIHVLRSNMVTLLPPGPPPLPIIGNILKIGNKPHQAITNLSKIYGPLMTLKLGSITTIVISSPDIAKEALQKHDQALSSRAIPDAYQLYAHHDHSMIWLPASGDWKNLRRIATSQMFTSQRLNASQELRQKKVQELLDNVTESCIIGQAVDIGRAAFTTVLNIITNTLFSTDMASYDSNSFNEFNDLVLGIMDGGKPSLADYFPILRYVDPQGVRRRTKIYFERLHGIFDGIINERTLSNASSTASKADDDLLDTLLSLAKEHDSGVNDLHIKSMLVDLLVAGTDTSSSTVEWAMAELLKNPEKFAILKNELKNVDGKVQESDIENLPYLQAVVKETWRLHPPAPFLVPHKAVSEVEIHGFKVPKNATILVNVWAMGNDKNVWPNPDSFTPERFLENETEVKGKDFKWIPFGAGRRMCPGLPLANRVVHLMLASLTHSFDWQLANGMKPDMNEEFGLTLHKSEPLLAIPIRK